MPRIFLSYRRSDSPHATGRIYDRLVERYGKESVFKDVDSIPIGVDFRKSIEHSIDLCTVVIAVIGSTWLRVTDEGGRRRLDNEADFVRLELEVASQRDRRVIPLLVDGAAMPASEELPAGLRYLSMRNAAAIRPDPDFHRDVARLIQAIDQVEASLEKQDRGNPQPTPVPIVQPVARNRPGGPADAEDELLLFALQEVGVAPKARTARRAAKTAKSSVPSRLRKWRNFWVFVVLAPALLVASANLLSSRYPRFFRESGDLLVGYGFLAFIAAVLFWVGWKIGDSKGRALAGGLLGLCVGPLGWLLVALGPDLRPGLVCNYCGEFHPLEPTPEVCQQCGKAWWGKPSERA